MQRIETLLQKMSELAQKGNKNTVIDIDLMMDYTRVIYADLLEWRSRSVFNTSLGPEVNSALPVANDTPIPGSRPATTTQAVVEKQSTPAPETKQVPVVTPEIQQPVPEASISPDAKTFYADTVAANHPTVKTEQPSNVAVPPGANKGEQIALATFDEPEALVTSPARPQQLFPGEPASAIKRKDIRDFIGINDKYQLISELFSNDKEAYEQMMNHINTFDSYDVAVQWLKDEVHERHQWLDDSSGVLTLYGLLSVYFASR